MNIMTNKYIRYVVALAIAVIMSVLPGCKDDEMGPDPVSGNGDIIVLSGISYLYEVVMPSDNGDWTVLSHPVWASPMGESGSAGESIILFVATNDEEAERTSELRVQFTNGKEIVYKLLQRENDLDTGGAGFDEFTLNKTGGVGYPINVFFSSGSSKYAINNATPLYFSKVEAALKAIGETDAWVQEDRYYSRSESMTGNSTSAIANQLSINAGIEVGISAFKIGVEAGYSQSKSSDEKYAYAMQEIQHIVRSCYLRPGALRYLAESGADIFQPTFKKYSDRLSQNPGDTDAMKKILNTYGTHIITQGSLGGELTLSMEMRVTSNTSGSDIHAALDLGVKVLDVKGEFNMSEKQKAISKNTTISLRTYGGSNVYSIAPGATFESFYATVRDKSKLDAWVARIKTGEELALIDVEVMPIYELLPTQAARDAMREYMMGEYQSEQYSSVKDYFGPELYCLTGFGKYDTDKTTPWLSRITLPQIDTDVVVKRQSIKELSGDDLLTIVYSGSAGKVDYNRGFFIGSSALKPCKFSYDKKGRFSKEEFNLHSEIEAIYVDATGDLTIAPNSIASQYRNIEFSNWGYNIEDYKGTSFVVDKNMPLAGYNSSLDVVIKDGCEVTLNNVAIRHIKCEGVADIILGDGSQNSVTNDDWDGRGVAISIAAPNGITTISGGGSLNLYSVGPCICSHQNQRGDLIIEDGILNCVSRLSPAIGGRDLRGLDRIIIKGGDITASTNLANSTAIGSYISMLVSPSLVNRIEIKKSVRRVRVHKGSDALEAIGRSSYADKVNVYIEDPSKIEEF